MGPTSNAARAAVLLVAVAVLVVLFIVLSDGDEDSSADSASAPATTTAEAPAELADGAPVDPEEDPEPEPEIPTVVVANGEPRGGVAELRYGLGDRIRFRVRSDLADEVHVHGYDLFENVAPGDPARFSFEADIDGIYEVELEHAGVQIIELRVDP